ncbi:hypothetical protein [Treponema sp. Marseille-Q3903]|uniref:hypothetical protein n=1 Tax=Treponema sp. Marseille-Q3903 TaxID=2766703 RepID=UPI0016520D22|nr:hypothetical protein [Treponema sp. Marseille-Q3903]MBC6713576.1 hypothetical protein [Treponema sp. Marseille-Q3903]
MSGIIHRFSPALRKLSGSVERIIYGCLYFLDNHFTWLSVLVLAITGTALYYIFGYMFRYSRPDWWNWKRKAFFKSILLLAFLIMIKGVFQIVV